MKNDDVHYEKESVHCEQVKQMMNEIKEDRLKCYLCYWMMMQMERKVT